MRPGKELYVVLAKLLPLLASGAAIFLTSEIVFWYQFSENCNIQAFLFLH